MTEDDFLDLLSSFVDDVPGINAEQILVGNEAQGEVIVSFSGLVEPDEI